MDSRELRTRNSPIWPQVKFTAVARVLPGTPRERLYTLALRLPCPARRMIIRRAGHGRRRWG